MLKMMSIKVVLLIVAHFLHTALSENYLLYFLNEESPPDTPIGELINDYGLNKKYNQSILEFLKFTILMQPNFDEPYIEVNEATGRIKTINKIDREKVCPRSKTCTIKFDVAVMPTQYFEIIKVKIDIQDINDNYPTFPDRRMHHVMSEAAEVGSGVIVPAAVDLDSEKFGIQRYEIFPPNGKFALKIGPSRLDGETDLRLLLREKLDREAEERYQVIVYAVDGGSPPNTGSIVVDIDIHDANDNAPEFENTTYEVNVLENLPVGTILIKVKATDKDSGTNGIITYKFSKHTVQEFGHLFGIKPDSGKIFLKSPLDFEKDRIHLLSVSASDRGPDSLPSHASVIVRVMDVNDNPPVITVNTLAGERLANVAEHSSIGTFVAHARVEDLDDGENGRVSCSIDNNQFSFQQLHPTEFKIVNAVEFDREKQHQYDVTITCKDNGDTQFTSESKLKVHITDINDHSPVFRENPINVNVKENAKVGTEVLKATADDSDEGQNAQIAYSLSDNAVDYLSIDHVTGLITTNRIFDRENMETFVFTVTARDQGEPRLTGTTTVILSVIDEDDEKAIFPVDRYTFSIGENQPVGTVIGRVTAIDRDLSPHDSFIYFIESGGEIAEIDQTTGILKSKVTFDRESQSTYQLVVVAASENDESHNAKATVIISIADENDNRPIFTTPANKNETVGVSSFANQGHIVTYIKAVDADTGQNANISYIITGGNRRQLLSLEPYTGALKINSRQLSNIEFEDVFLAITAKDGGSPSLKSEAELRVVISKDIVFRPLTDGSTLRQTILENEDTVIFLAIAFAVILVGITIIAGVIIVLRTKTHRRDGAMKNGQQNSGIAQKDGRINNGQEKNCSNPQPTQTVTKVLAKTKGHKLVSGALDDECKFDWEDDVTNRKIPASDVLTNGLLGDLSGTLEKPNRGNYLSQDEALYGNNKNYRDTTLKPVVAFVNDERQTSKLSDWPDMNKEVLFQNGSAHQTERDFDRIFSTIGGLYEPVLPRSRGYSTNSFAGTISTPARYNTPGWSTPDRHRAAPGCNATPSRHAPNVYATAGRNGANQSYPKKRSNSNFDAEIDADDQFLPKSITANNFHYDLNLANGRTETDRDHGFDILQNDYNLYKNNTKCNMFLM